MHVGTEVYSSLRMMIDTLFLLDNNKDESLVMEGIVF